MFWKKSSGSDKTEMEQRTRMKLNKLTMGKKIFVGENRYLDKDLNRAHRYMNKGFNEWESTKL